MRYLILSVDYNSEAMEDIPCSACGHSEIGSAGGCMHWEYENGSMVWCGCSEHKVSKSAEEPIESIVSLRWISDTLAESGTLTLTEDGESEYASEGFASWHRKWSGEVSEATYRKLSDDWGFDASTSEPNIGMITERGYLSGYRWNFDGSEWNSGGWSPISFADLSVECTEAEFLADPTHFGFMEGE